MSGIVARHLVDANVLFQATKPEGDPRVVEWLRRNEAHIAVDPIILGGVRFGILLLARGRRRSRLEQWFDDGVMRLNCIPWTHRRGCGGPSCSLTCAPRAERCR